MDIVSGGLILVFCLVGGGVALLADNLGRSIGKKRISILRLRPKHTATVFITVAGFFIPLLTVIMLSILSQDLRTILREGSRLISERDRVKSQLTVVKTQLDSETSKVTSARNLAAKIEGQRKDAEQKLTKARSEVQSQQTHINELQRRGNELKANAARLQHNLAQLAKTAENLNSKNSLYSSNLKVLKDDIRSYNSQINKLNSEIDSLTTQSTNLSNEAKRLEIEKQKGLQDIRDQEARFETILNDYKDRIEGKTAELAELERQAQDLANRMAQLQGNASAARVQGLIFAINDEVGRVALPAGMTYPEADRAIDQALKAARDAAKRRGADDSPVYRAADFHQMGEGPSAISPSAQRQALREELVRQSQPQVMILSAVWNTFAGESVPLRYRLVENRIVFQPGDIIAETRIDGSKDQKVVLKALTDWFSNQLPYRLTQARIEPIKGSAEPFGSIEPDTLVSLVDQIRHEGRILRVQVLAKKEIRVAGPVTFEVRLR